MLRLPLDDATDPPDRKHNSSLEHQGNTRSPASTLTLRAACVWLRAISGITLKHLGEEAQLNCSSVTSMEYEERNSLIDKVRRTARVRDWPNTTPAVELESRNR